MNRVCVVEDDHSMRQALNNLLRSAGFTPELFASAHEFLSRLRSELPGCLITDIRLPGISGLDLQRELAAARIRIPIIFIIGHADDLDNARAMEGGAVGFFKKPFSDTELLKAVEISLALPGRGQGL